jgi:His/Glu/Gln/Arg/opine family amino acid ABC transporter permease subunit
MFDLAFVSRNLAVFIDGLWITLLIGSLAMAGALLGGGIVAASKMSPRRALAAAGSAYVECLRNTPVLVQIFILYFGLPTLDIYPSAVASAVAALVLQNSAYLGEIYRSAIESVPRRQMEAAQAVGMTPFKAYRVVIVPQALRRALPGIGNQMIFIIKDTSIASTIAVAELTHAGQLLLDRSAAPYEVFLILAAFYLALTALLQLAVKALELVFPVRA